MITIIHSDLVRMSTLDGSGSAHESLLSLCVVCMCVIFGVGVASRCFESNGVVHRSLFLLVGVV